MVQPIVHSLQQSERGKLHELSNVYEVYLFWIVNDKRTSADGVTGVLQWVNFPCNQLVTLVILSEPFVGRVWIALSHTSEDKDSVIN